MTKAVKNINGKVNLWGRILSWSGWTPLYPETFHAKSVICVAPHTSNWDFIIGYLYYKAWGAKLTPRFLIKKEWFVFPFNFIFKALGGLPVDRKLGGSTVDQAIDLLKKAKSLHLGITPEGTRKRREHWKTGFYRIAKGAGVPIELAKIDYKNKVVGVFHTIQTFGDNIEERVQDIRRYYHSSMAKKPKNFSDINQ